ncbi:hypothetical protein, unlikely [Trypanosoma brucei gambiense DAL972]|uniref:Uncharacterized protein n=1 Tax=Trypanosoma brucei gambiense (strain MHOM/CI/86/DAL972) TaxID=679716 RepID=D0A3D7_TRYB9|nr:hypothetical protein, unlikely [Trypanosoma brucei gambiense DAL972]CBH15781.1 hypothetical protein, unlikely [Trypanosoma brucei gambiense DAL972]|eukprot:XP_011778045.1 hypothetical protein, unlikely [Trypanosoma brucei gambiense DAL972]
MGKMCFTRASVTLTGFAGSVMVMKLIIAVRLCSSGEVGGTAHKKENVQGKRGRERAGEREKSHAYPHNAKHLSFFLLPPFSFSVHERGLSCVPFIRLGRWKGIHTPADI